MIADVPAPNILLKPPDLALIKKIFARHEPHYATRKSCSRRWKNTGGKRETETHKFLCCCRVCYLTTIIYHASLIQLCYIYPAVWWSYLTVAREHHPSIYDTKVVHFTSNFSPKFYKNLLLVSSRLWGRDHYKILHMCLWWISQNSKVIW